MKKLLLLLISFLGVFTACHREPVEPTPGNWGGDTNVCLYGIRTAVYEPKAAVESVVSSSCVTPVWALCGPSMHSQRSYHSVCSVCAFVFTMPYIFF